MFLKALGSIISTYESVGWKRYEIRFLDTGGMDGLKDDVTWICAIQAKKKEIKHR